MLVSSFRFMLQLQQQSENRNSNSCILGIMSCWFPKGESGGEDTVST